MTVSRAGARGGVLLIDDEGGVRDGMAKTLGDAGYDVAAVAAGEALLALGGRVFDVVVADLHLPDGDGLVLLRHMHEHTPDAPVLLMTTAAAADSAVAALRAGARDYLLTPARDDELLHRVQTLIEHGQLAWQRGYLAAEVERELGLDHLIGHSAAMREVMELTKRMAAGSSAVLISGEPGVGKTVVARAIHRASDRRDGIFVRVDCGDVAEPALESRLFGHRRGAFRGALVTRAGLCEQARQSTIFLDEVAHLSWALQEKLLGVLERQEVLAVGATTSVPVDVRIIAATARDLRREVEAGRFRHDLYDRLSAARIDVPPLRERRDDIPPLVDYFMRRLNRVLKTRFKGADATTLAVFTTLPWKGNVRELKNVVEHAMIVGEGEWLTAADLPRGVRSAAQPTAGGDNLRQAVRAYERAHILAVLARLGHDKRRAAEQLGVSLSSLYRKLEELSIPLSPMAGDLAAATGRRRPSR